MGVPIYFFEQAFKRRHSFKCRIRSPHFARSLVEVQLSTTWLLSSGLSMNERVAELKVRWNRLFRWYNDNARELRQRVRSGD